MKWFKSVSAAVMVCAAVLMAGCQKSNNAALSQPWYVAPGLSEKQPAKVGVVKRMDLLTAYYRSTLHAAYIDELTAKRDEAVKAGDKTLAAQCEDTGASNQEIAHQQLAGKAPLTNIITALQSDLPAIASEAGVEAIYEAGKYHGSAPTVDITSLVTAKFEPAARWKDRNP